MRKKRMYPGLDLFKYISALLVVAIHVFPFVTISETFNTLFLADVCRLAVPFFFVCSGFLFFRKERSHRYSELIRYEKRIGLLYLLWTLIYSPWIVSSIYTSDNWLLALIRWIRDFFLEGSWYHLWFLPALMLGMVIVWALLRRIGESRTMITCLVLYLIGYVINIFGPTLIGIPVLGWIFYAYDAIFGTARNGIFFAPLFIMLGWFLAKVGKPNRMACIAGAGVSWVLMCLEVWLYWSLGILQDLSCMFLFLIPTVFFLTGVALHLKLRPSPLWKSLREESTVIYTSHILFVSFLFSLFPDANLVVYVLTLALSSALAWGIIKLAQTFPIVRKLY